MRIAPYVLSRRTKALGLQGAFGQPVWGPTYLFCGPEFATGAPTIGREIF